MAGGPAWDPKKGKPLRKKAGGLPMLGCCCGICSVCAADKLTINVDVTLPESGHIWGFLGPIQYVAYLDFSGSAGSVSITRAELEKDKCSFSKQLKGIQVEAFIVDSSLGVCGKGTEREDVTWSAFVSLGYNDSTPSVGVSLRSSAGHEITLFNAKFPDNGDPLFRCCKASMVVPGQKLTQTVGDLAVENNSFGLPTCVSKSKVITWGPGTVEIELHGSGTNPPCCANCCRKLSFGVKDAAGNLVYLQHVFNCTWRATTSKSETGTGIFSPTITTIDDYILSRGSNSWDLAHRHVVRNDTTGQVLADTTAHYHAPIVNGKLCPPEDTLFRLADASSVVIQLTCAEPKCPTDFNSCCKTLLVEFAASQNPCFTQTSMLLPYLGGQIYQNDAQHAQLFCEHGNVVIEIDVSQQFCGSCPGECKIRYENASWDGKCPETASGAWSITRDDLGGAPQILNFRCVSNCTIDAPNTGESGWSPQIIMTGNAAADGYPLSPAGPYFPENGAEWITEGNASGQHNDVVATDYDFTCNVFIGDNVDLSTMSVGGFAGADESAEVFVNGVSQGFLVGDFLGSESDHPFEIPNGPHWQHGNNTVVFRVHNGAGTSNNFMALYVRWVNTWNCP